MKRDRAISIQKPVCSDSIVSNPNSTASLWRLFQQHRPKPDIGQIEIPQHSIAVLSPSEQKDLVQARRLERSLRETEDRSGGSHGFAREAPTFAPAFLSLLHAGRGFCGSRWLAYTTRGFCGGARARSPHQGQCGGLASDGV